MIRQMLYNLSIIVIVLLDLFVEIIMQIHFLSSFLIKGDVGNDLIDIFKKNCFANIMIVYMM